ncbi:MAG: hypothetical protein ACU843_17480 [Gammaproteobacteria bacterium]
MNPEPRSWEGTPVVKLKQEQYVDTQTLGANQKRILWEGLKLEDPEVANLLMFDENVKEIVSRFNGSPMFKVQDFNRYIAAGIRLVGRDPKSIVKSNIGKIRSVLCQ